jgi:hypothetical protein
MDKSVLQAFEKLKKEHRRLSKTGLDDDAAQFLRLFLDAMSNAKKLIELCQQLIDQQKTA